MRRGNHRHTTHPLSLLGSALLLFTLLLPSRSTAQAPAFAVGEDLTYVVSYKAGIMRTDVAEVRFRVGSSSLQGVPTYQVVATGKTFPHYNWFFKLNDTYTTQMAQSDLRPLQLSVELREGDYRYSGLINYDWQQGVAHSAYRNHKQPDTTFKQLPLKANSRDALTQLYHLRQRSPESFTAGRSERISLVLDDTIRYISLRYMGREEKRIKGLGVCKTLRFTCQMATSTGESFEDGDEFTVWISDDANKIPLYIDSPIRVGSIQAHLTSAKGLRTRAHYEDK